MHFHTTFFNAHMTYVSTHQHVYLAVIENSIKLEEPTDKAVPVVYDVKNSGVFTRVAYVARGRCVDPEVHSTVLYGSRALLWLKIVSYEPGEELVPIFYRGIGHNGCPSAENIMKEGTMVFLKVIVAPTAAIPPSPAPSWASTQFTDSLVATTPSWPGPQGTEEVKKRLREDIFALQQQLLLLE